ncbi:MAG: TVP38/TMEM64 family protein [Rhodopseudomonas palustris]|uniref:TVP38/TMEM64 family membrane protein n=1 Tax=Rhodopseudomonas palustris TaxID=1076 RepID=A0A933S1Z9_RHOPL|nr:TVP38/TMEM64 family protein [Rhodopseudomonas palustris]
MSWETIAAWIAGWGRLDAVSASFLAAIYVVMAFVPFPRTLLLIGSGAALGPGALVVILPSTTLGCVLAFLTSRWLIRSWVEQQVQKRKSWRVVAQAIDDEAWQILALLRFWGPFPNFVQNYLFGLSKIGLLSYTLVTFVFALPQILLYTYLGALGRAALLDDGSFPYSNVIAGIVAVVVLSVIVLISTRVRTILATEALRPKAGGVSTKPGQT